MSHVDTDIIALLKYQNKWMCYKSPAEYWGLDWSKWRKDFVDAGYWVPDVEPTDRLGIAVVDELTVDFFVKGMSAFAIDTGQIGDEIAKISTTAHSVWSVLHLLPTVFVDADRHRLEAFYLDGPPLERYVADGWIGVYADFILECSESELPYSQRYWVRNGVDHVVLLNNRTRGMDRRR